MKLSNPNYTKNPSKKQPPHEIWIHRQLSRNFIWIDFRQLFAFTWLNFNGFWFGWSFFHSFSPKTKRTKHEKQGVGTHLSLLSCKYTSYHFFLLPTYCLHPIANAFKPAICLLT